MNTKTPNNSETKGFFSRLKRGLSKTREILTTDIDDLFSANRKLDEDLLEELEELLITSDIGVSTAMDIMNTISKKASEIKDAQSLKQVLKDEITGIMGHVPPTMDTSMHIHLSSPLSANLRQDRPPRARRCLLQRQTPFVRLPSNSSQSGLKEPRPRL